MSTPTSTYAQRGFRKKLIYGAIIVLIARFQPGGIVNLIKRLWAKRGKPPAAPVGAGASHAP